MSTTTTPAIVQIPHFLEALPATDGSHKAMLHVLLPQALPAAIIAAQHYPRWDIDGSGNLGETHEGGWSAILDERGERRRFRGCVPCGHRYGVDLSISPSLDGYTNLLVMGLACPFEGNDPTWYSRDTLHVLFTI